MIFLVYCIASLFYYVFLLSPAPTWYIFLLLWHDIAYLLKVPLNTKQTNKQKLSDGDREKTAASYFWLYFSLCLSLCTTHSTRACSSWDCGRHFDPVLYKLAGHRCTKWELKLLVKQYSTLTDWPCPSTSEDLECSRFVLLQVGHPWCTTT